MESILALKEFLDLDLILITEFDLYIGPEGITFRHFGYSILIVEGKFTLNAIFNPMSTGGGVFFHPPYGISDAIFLRMEEKISLVDEFFN